MRLPHGNLLLMTGWIVVGEECRPAFYPIRVIRVETFKIRSEIKKYLF
jgi:hypothetical protein